MAAAAVCARLPRALNVTIHTGSTNSTCVSLNFIRDIFQAVLIPSVFRIDILTSVPDSLSHVPGKITTTTIQSRLVLFTISFKIDQKNV